nr:hypothetical protein [Dryocola boscaweniae]
MFELAYHPAGVKELEMLPPVLKGKMARISRGQYLFIKEEKQSGY